ncbi:MAG: type II toxin-antitoxin system Phd/YefM family antitoxin [Leptolyngbyaceae cyanobacterium CSU_1_3]|nr:type II toxin-antitoxin system Phd/YefM family antitoxin [Leptolyngbyaceae cyanobacterium CSU_1_3]
MKIAPIAEIKAQLSAFIKASEEGPVVITKNGKAVAVLLGISDEDEIERLALAYSKKLRTFLDAAENECARQVEFRMMNCGDKWMPPTPIQRVMVRLWLRARASQCGSVAVKAPSNISWRRVGEITAFLKLFPRLILSSA